MDVWIDTAGAAGSTPMFGLPPLDRLLRTLAKTSVRPGRVIQSGPEDGPAGERLRRALGEAADGLLALDAAVVCDPRLLDHLLRPGPDRAAFGSEGAESAAGLRLSPSAAASIPADATSVLQIARALHAADVAPALAADEMPAFISKLRRSEPFWLFTIPDQAARRRRERWMFLSNYKGSTDFLTRWVYPPVVWPLVRLSIRWRIHPNVITAVSVALAFLCVPFFATGQWPVGFAMAYAMTVLDSVDGKVARLTLTDSRIGDVMDHGLDIVHPPFWYLAWAWGLGARTTADPAMQATLALVALYIADRLVLAVAKRKFGRGLHAVTSLDGAVRSWIARRNVNLAIFTAALLLGHGVAGLYVVTAWSGLTVLWHAWRTAVLPRPAPAGALA